jgi:DNA-binding HxlR family transcriptional regulator
MRGNVVKWCPNFLFEIINMQADRSTIAKREMLKDRSLMETLPTGLSNLYSEQCPTRMILDRITDKWTVLIILHLSTGTRRFGELRHTIGRISPRVLT